MVQDQPLSTLSGTVWARSSIPGDTNATRGNAPWTTRNNTGNPTPGIHQDCGISNPGTSAGHTGPSSTRHGRAAGSGCTGSSGRGTDTPTAGDTRDTGRPSGQHHGHDNSRWWWAGNYRTGRATGKQGRWGARTWDTSGGRASTCGIFWDRDVLGKVGPLHFGSRNSTQRVTMAEGCQWGCSMHQHLQGQGGQPPHLSGFSHDAGGQCNGHSATLPG
jgi:hypothetical protein